MLTPLAECRAWDPQCFLGHVQVVGQRFSHLGSSLSPQDLRQVSRAADPSIGLSAALPEFACARCVRVTRCPGLFLVAMDLCLGTSFSLLCHAARSLCRHPTLPVPCGDLAPCSSAPSMPFLSYICSDPLCTLIFRPRLTSAPLLSYAVRFLRLLSQHFGASLSEATRLLAFAVRFLRLLSSAFRNRSSQ